jgi:hypothetical protein
MKLLLSCALGLAPFALSPAIQAAVNPAIVSAESRWVVYADLNALRASTLGKEFVAMAEKAQIDTGQGKIGIDVPKVLATIGTITAYGANFSPDPHAIDGTLVIQGTADLRKIAEGLLLQATIAHPDNVVEVTDLPFSAYTIKENKNATTGLVIAFPPEPIVLVSKSREKLLQARTLFQTGAGSIAKSPNAPLRDLVRQAADSYLFAASVVPSEKMFPEDQPQARILKMTNSGSLAIGEKGPNTFAHAELIATSDQMADKLMKILQGMTAMLSFAETNDKQLADFLNSTIVARHDDTVTLNLSYSSERLVQMLQLLRQHQQVQRSEDNPAARRTDLIRGKAVAEWTAEAGAASADSGASAVVWHTIENVELKNGTIITLGRQSNGGKPVRFDRIEIKPANGEGAPLVFRMELMRTTGPRGSQSQFQFPGVDGTYTLKVGYTNDPDGKATYAVSVLQPRSAAPAATAK